MSVELGPLDGVLAPLLDAVLAHWPIPGGVVAVVSGDDLVLHAFGAADPTADLPVRPQHLFEIGSISKIFTSIVINQLIDEGALALDTVVTEPLPWLVLPRGAGVVTVRQLLTHTAGLVAGIDGLPDELAQLWSMRNTSAGPAGEFFHYSNLGFVLLGRIITAVTGQSLALALRERVLAPAGMSHTLPEIRNADRPSLAVGSAPLMDDAPWLPGQPLVPATWLEASAGDGNVASDAVDMARFLRLLLAGSAGGAVPVISAESYARMIGTLAPGGEDTLLVGRHEPVLDSRYGLGINVERTAESMLLTHGGGMVGYASFLLADVGRGLGVVVLSNANGDTPIAELIARQVHAGLLDPTAVASGSAAGLDPLIWTERLGMAGSFVSGNPVAGDAEIELRFTDGGELILHSGEEQGRMLWTLQDRIACEHPAFSHSHFWFDDGPSGPAWIHGAQRFSAVGATGEPAAAVRAQAGRAPAVVDDRRAFEGHYRSHSPWFTNFRVFLRGSTLYLSAATGVEAPSAEQELVELEPGWFRIGADARLPERLTFGPVVDGRAIWADRDGCVYSRNFSR